MLFSKCNRTLITKQQTEILQGVFNVNQFPSKVIKGRLGKVTGLPLKTITNWFNNKRSKLRTILKQQPSDGQESIDHVHVNGITIKKEIKKEVEEGDEDSCVKEES